MPIKSMPVWKWSLLLLASLLLSFIMYGAGQTVSYVVAPQAIGIVVPILFSGAMIALYACFVRWFEKSPAKDIPRDRIVPDIMKGMGLGFGYFCALILIMSAIGLYKVVSIGTDQPLAIATELSMFLMVGVGEEIIFRGILFRWIDEKWGFLTALLVSSALFGLAHVFQPGATWWSILAIAIEAGLLLGSAYKYARTLWLPIGIHWGWNFTQGNIFGFAVSGGDVGVSLIQSTVNGPDSLQSMARRS